MNVLGVCLTGPEAQDVAALGAVVARAPGWSLRADLDLVALQATLVRLLRARDGLPRTPEGALPDHLMDAIFDYLRVVPQLTGRGRMVVADAGACADGRLLRGLARSMVGVVVADDPRRRFVADAPDLVEAAAAHGRRWAATLQPAVEVARANAHWRVACLVRPDVGTSLGAWLRRLGVVVPGAVVAPRPQLSWDPLMEAALRVSPVVDALLALLQMRRLPVAPPTAHPSLALAHVEEAVRGRDFARATALLPFCADTPDATFWRAVVARSTGDRTGAGALLETMLTNGSGEARVRIEALALGDHPLALRVAASVGADDPEPVRVALADWLVASGLDAEAAEVVARVEGTGWRAGVRVL